jgi:hypothetical protein
MRREQRNSIISMEYEQEDQDYDLYTNRTALNKIITCYGNVCSKYPLQEKKLQLMIIVTLFCFYIQVHMKLKTYCLLPYSL